MTDADPAPHANVSSVIDALVRAWSAGDGAGFAEPFGEEGWFVAFDGTVLQGPPAIGAYHQQAFSTHLAGTTLKVTLTKVRTLATGLLIAQTLGGIERDGESHGGLIGASIQTYVLREHDGRLWIESFQNTRDRPITGPQAAKVWRDFDAAWNGVG